MSLIPTQVVSVAARTTRNGKTLYDVTLSDGQKYTAFDPALAQKAANLQGQSVQADVEVTQNGQYTNYNLKGVYGPGESAPAQPVQIAPQAVVAVGAPAPGIIQPAPPVAQGGGGGNSMSPQTVERITRLSALQAASSIVGQLFSGAGEVPLGTLAGATLQLSEAFVKYAFEGTGPVGQVVTPAAAMAPQSGAEVAQLVNAQAQGAVVQVGAPADSPVTSQNTGGPQGDGIPWE